MDYDKITDDLLNEVAGTLKSMSKTKKIDEKEAYSRILKNLCDSLEVFFNMATEIMEYGDFDDYDDD